MRAFRSIIITSLGAVLCFSALSTTAMADTKAVYTVDQVSPKEYGSWVVYSGDTILAASSERGVSSKHYSFSSAVFGSITLSVKNPPGMTSIIKVYRNDDLIQTTSTPQVAISSFPNDSYRFIVQYARTNLGSLGVTSVPSNVAIMIKGPDGKERRALTPHTFTNLPVGRYAIYTPNPPAPCGSAAPMTRSVESEKRLAVSIELPCAQEVSSRPSRTRARPTKREIQNSVYLREAQRSNKK